MLMAGKRISCGARYPLEDYCGECDEFGAGWQDVTGARPRRRSADGGPADPAQTTILGHLRDWNIIAAFGSAADARRACAALRRAREDATITASQGRRRVGDVRLGRFASDRTVIGGLVEALRACSSAGW
jgi:hypothetical protein